MNPILLRASADAMRYDSDPRFYLLGLLLEDLANEVEAGLCPDHLRYPKPSEWPALGLVGGMLADQGRQS